jgi:hypothetical protein
MVLGLELWALTLSRQVFYHLSYAPSSFGMRLKKKDTKVEEGLFGKRKGTREKKDGGQERIMGVCEYDQSMLYACIKMSQ